MEVQNLARVFNNILTTGKKQKTRVVDVGGIPLGGDFPVRIQSMTSTPTMDTTASVEQCIRIIDAGADYVRLTAQNIREAENLGRIREALRKRGYQTPLIADVHFNPAVAEVAATMVEKIRINPGNFVRTQHDFKDHEAGEKIRERLIPLLDICKKNNTAIRIGVNHGSLAERIIRQYGDTPQGMVVSAMEFLRVCKEEDFHRLVFSMKSSNTRVMVYAYRMLIAAMAEEGELYPLHIGITEAGEGLYGRIKSAAGISALLADGFGDTVRVSLTEPPENEIPVAHYLVTEAENKRSRSIIGEKLNHPFRYVEPSVHNGLKKHFGTNHIVISSKTEREVTDAQENNLKPDLYCSTKPDANQGVEQNILVSGFHTQGRKDADIFDLSGIDSYDAEEHAKAPLNFIEIEAGNLKWQDGEYLKDTDRVVFIVSFFETDTLANLRSFLIRLRRNCSGIPVVLKCHVKDGMNTEKALTVSSLTGPLFLDALAEGIWIEAEPGLSSVSEDEVAFAILQATRMRSVQPEYISCPSCGRTLFDIQKVSAEIRKRTAHLKGLKIGIMGCIVNGPGEMADADYGYVGSGPNKITLYKNRKVVKRNIPAYKAVDELVLLIKENGDWTEP